MKTIKIFDLAGVFAENKDVARDIRVTKIIPALKKNGSVVLNFSRVDAATQSFIHALISGVLRKFGPKALDHMAFKSCTENVQKMISIVVDYMMEGMDE